MVRFLRGGIDDGIRKLYFDVGEHEVRWCGRRPKSCLRQIGGILSPGTLNDESQGPLYHRGRMDVRVKNYSITLVLDQMYMQEMCPNSTGHDRTCASRIQGTQREALQY